MVDGMSRVQLVAGCESFLVGLEWRNWTAYLLGLLFIGLSFASVAEELADPTRPPVSVSTPVDESVRVETKLEPGLQSILIAKNRRAAIIDGQTVEIGGRVGEARLIEVNAMNVVLKTSKGKQVLMLFPDVMISKTKNDAPPVQTAKKVSNGDKK
jgi:MSHA biogenesis protein MshK